MTDDIPEGQVDHTQLTVDVVAAYAANNSLRAADLPGLIAEVHAALVRMSDPPADAPQVSVEKATPAQVKRSITPDALISFVDGKPYKTLKRHLSTHGLTLDAYRTRYGLPADYPAVSASYSAARSALARSFGLGQHRQEAAQPSTEAVEPAVKPVRGRGRPKRAAEPTPAD